ncbi:MAG: protein meaA, partial [Desulfobacterales bacterium]|nr:protein meaA [Desulfobacterales bacterium]
MTDTVNHPKDRTWLMRTYSGYASAKESNQLYKTNLEKGQTGLSIAFDLPTQTGYDSDSIYAKGEVGKLGVPMRSHEDMETLFDQIPIAKMNTSMTINAPTAWLLSLYLATAKKQGADISQLRGTTQNDILKEYLSRGTYIFPPRPSMRLTAEVISFTLNNIPKWNPINICSYHLQETGATPVQELAFTLANAITVLDTVKELGDVTPEDFPKVVGRISFFLNAGIRFIEEMCKVRVFTSMWDRICKERYNVTDPKMRRFRYGLQVNSLGLTDHQPENNIARIIYELLGVVLSKKARSRSVQLPAWNEALGLPRKWDQQWSLRLQQILAFETDLLEYEDIFDGSQVIDQKEKELEDAAQA